MCIEFSPRSYLTGESSLCDTMHTGYILLLAGMDRRMGESVPLPHMAADEGGAALDLDPALEDADKEGDHDAEYRQRDVLDDQVQNRRGESGDAVEQRADCSIEIEVGHGVVPSSELYDCCA